MELLKNCLFQIGVGGGVVLPIPELQQNQKSSRKKLSPEKQGGGQRYLDRFQIEMENPFWWRP